jgi:hypothetical protein
VADQDYETQALGAPAPDAELRRLEPLVGSWESADHTLDGVYGPGVPVTNKETFSWLDGGYYLVQTYETVFGDQPAQKGVNYWFYEPDQSQFHIIFFANNGPYSDPGSHYRGGVDDDKLTMVGPARFQYDLDQDGRIKTNPDGTLEVRWWVRAESGDWMPWMTNIFRRVDSRHG